jgi:hypothetical protein
MSVLVERIWWSVGRENLAPAEADWSDKPLVVERDAFRATSNAVLYFRFPKPRWADEALVGFAEDKRRPYSLRVDSMHVAIPLREFGDAADTTDRFREAALRAWVNDRVIEGSGPIVVVRGETPVAAPSPPMSHPELWLGTISSAKLARTLNLLSHRVRWPLRAVMERLYEARPKPRGQLNADVVNFKEQALCAIALASDSVQEGSAAAFRVPKRRREQALRAADAFPEVWQRMRRKYRASQRRRMPR